MIDAIAKIPKEKLIGQQELSKSKTYKDNKFTVVFLDTRFNIEKTGKGTFSEICKNNELNETQKKLIEKFNDYRGITEFGGNFNRKSFGGKQALATCSLLHYDFTKEGGTITKALHEGDTKYINNVLKVFEENKCNKYSSVLPQNPEFKSALKKIVENLFLPIKPYLFENKIVVLPKDPEFIEEYNKFHRKFLNMQSNRDNLSDTPPFNLEVHEGFQKDFAQLYSKFGNNKIIYQKEGINTIDKETFIKLDLFKKALANHKGILPLPLITVPKHSNIYATCFSEKSLLQKLKEIYLATRSKPFNYLLVSNFENEGFRFERVVQFDFNCNELINEAIYSIRFNKLKRKKEIIAVEQKPTNHTKFELFFDMVTLFWNLKEENAIKKEISFFKPKIKNNPFLNQILCENAAGIISLIYKQNNSFIKYRLPLIINSILAATLRNEELKQRYNSTIQMRKLLMVFYKYEGMGEMTEELKEIEGILKKLVASDKLDEIKSDNAALYLAGQIMAYLLSKTSSGGSKLQLMSKNLLSITSTDNLKQKICELTSKYSHNVYDTKRWNIANKRFLEYEFNDQRFRDKLIPFFTGFYADNIFFEKKEKETETNVTTGRD